MEAAWGMVWVTREGVGEGKDPVGEGKDLVGEGKDLVGGWGFVVAVRVGKEAVAARRWACGPGRLLAGSASKVVADSPGEV